MNPDHGPHPDGDASAALSPETRHEDLRRSERRTIVVRWAAAGFALLQVVAYENPYPAGVFATALGLVGALVAGNLVFTFAHRRTTTFRQVKTLSITSLAFDAAVASAFVWLWAFDQLSALWAILFILPLQGAIRFQFRGAMVTWGAVAVVYTLRELWGSATYGYEFLWNSVTFRMGIGFLIALIAGYMARDLTHQRALVARSLDEVQRIDRLRAALVSTLAHDVRNPLTSIRGTLRTVVGRATELSPVVTEELLRAADTQAARLERLANDLLDLARLERGRLELVWEDVGLAETVRRAVGYVDGGEAFEIRIPDDLVIRADPGRLEQIVVNLAANALRYGEAPFEIGSVQRDGDVTVEFRDGGAGVPEQAQEELFEPFRTEQDKGSVGFGLAIVRALAEAHGGGVTYRTNEPRGACFEVTLPVSGPADEE